jgi:hypothetical protein
MHMMKTCKRALGLVATMACASILTHDARAQTTCQGHTGPDVIVGDITGPANYSAIGGYEALSLGSYSCNMGTQPVGWHAGTNQHPVIGGELYRYKVVNGAGRFEQVGLSWLKHGFYALSNNLCCNNCQPTDGSILGVGCSDPYTASRNGDPTGMGPRYQVNAHTGFFIYPPPAPSGGNTGRLEVAVTDLEVSSSGGTRYFGNCQYVTPDDATANNQNNNSSYREVTVTGSGSAWTFGFTGGTHREIPAIKAWQACESGVTMTNIQLANEGLLIFGFKTTPLSGGQYHYEYAIYNMNSDLSVGSFSLPVPANVTLSNVGFHDVTRRGGDGGGGINYDGTDWPHTNAGGNLSWSTSTFAQNQNANAIRWGTTYNFHFDANASPTSGTITIGTFKNAGSVQTTSDVPGGTVTNAPFCFGDGSLLTYCPCFNYGDPAHGCENSQTTHGAILGMAGSVSPDTAVLTSSGELPSALTIFLQGDGMDSNGLIYGDGVRCVVGTLKRLYVKNASAGVVSAPAGGDLSITARSAALGDPISPGSTRYYQCYYRDPSPSFCSSPTGSTFNVSSGQIIFW